MEYKKTIHTFWATLVLAIATLLLPACEDFHENNGDLGGMWQLTEWRQGTTTVATSEDLIFYSIHRELIQYTHFSSREQKYKNEIDYMKRYFSMFRHTPDSLILHTFVNALDESKLAEYSQIKEFGIPEDGRFHIDRLDANHLVLSYDGNVLSFRKY